MSNYPFEIDTKGVCLFCLTSNNCRIYGDIKGDKDDLPPTTTSRAFKMFLRYLKVDLGKMTVGGGATSNQAIVENVNLSVFLCEDCSSRTNEFLDLYQTFDNIRLQLDLCVGQLHSNMEEGSQDVGRFREYMRRINAGKPAGPGTVIVDCLRQTALEKAGQKVHNSWPRVSLDELDTEFEAVDKARSTATISSDIFVDVDGDDENSGFEDERQGEQAAMGCGSTGENDFDEGQRMDVDVGMATTEDSANSKNGCSSLEIPGCGLEESRGAEFGSRPSVVADKDENMAVNNVTVKQENNVVIVDGKGMPILEPMDGCSGTGLQIPVDIQEEVAESEAESESSVEFLAEIDFQRMPFLEPMNSGLTTRKQWECGYCSQTYTQRMSLVNHQYGKHATDLLSKGGFLPPGISEQQLQTSVAAILGGPRAKTMRCPYCDQANFRSTCYVRVHILREHPQQVAEQVAPGFVPERALKQPKTPWKCVHCRHHFHSDKYLEFHLVSIHTMSHLSSQDKLPPNISEEQLEKSVADLFAQVKDSECPLCDQRVFKKRSLRRLRGHLLKDHLQEVLDNINKNESG